MDIENWQSNTRSVTASLNGFGFEHEAACIRFEPRNGHLVAHFETPVTSGGIYELCNRIDEAIGYYGYDTLELRLHSPGGSAAALKHFITRSNRWAGQGIILRTTALNEACSAAAFMLSSGTLGQRSAQFHTALVYHFARLSADDVFSHMQRQSDGQLTARGSHKAASDLRAIERKISQEDDLLIGQLYDHILGSADWCLNILPGRIAQVGKWLERNAKNIAANRGQSGEPKRTLARLQRSAVSGEQTKEGIRAEIRRVFERDAPIHPVLAYLLLLIDRIDGLAGFDDAYEAD